MGCFFQSMNTHPARRNGARAVALSAVEQQEATLAFLRGIFLLQMLAAGVLFLLPLRAHF